MITGRTGWALPVSRATDTTWTFTSQRARPRGDDLPLALPHTTVGTDRGPRLERTKLEASFDGGATWTETPMERGRAAR